MSARRRILVTLEGREMRVRGYGSRELLSDVIGRPPMWSRTDRAWCAQAHRLADVLALGQRLSYDVVVEGDLPAPSPAPVVRQEPAAGAGCHDEVPLW